MSTDDLPSDEPEPEPEPGAGPASVAVVIGAGGIGIAVARRLGRGRRLVLADSDGQQLGRAAGTLREEGYAVDEVTVDITDGDAVVRLASDAARLGSLAAVVNTAGVSPVQVTSRRIVDVDVVGTAHVLDAFAPHAGPGSVAVCIASMAGHFASLAPEVDAALATTPTAELADLAALDADQLDPGMAYVVAKRANQVRVQAASIAWGRRGGRVVSISPGIISTPMGQEELSGASGDHMRLMIEQSGTGRIGTPDDIAAVVEFLLSPAASFITGTDILVDGGAIAAALRGATT